MRGDHGRAAASRYVAGCARAVLDGHAGALFFLAVAQPPPPEAFVLVGAPRIAVADEHGMFLGLHEAMAFDARLGHATAAFVQAQFKRRFATGLHASDDEDDCSLMKELPPAQETKTR